LLFPIIPQSAEKSLKSLNVSISKISLESINNHEFLPKGGSLNNQGILFKKIINK
jgi:methionyl-tRNA synthetase